MCLPWLCGGGGFCPVGRPPARAGWWGVRSLAGIWCQHALSELAGRDGECTQHPSACGLPQALWQIWAEAGLGLIWEQKINHNGHGWAGFWCLWARPGCRAHIEISEKVTDGNTWSISLSEGLGHHTAQRANASQHLLLLPQTTHRRVKTHSSCRRIHICSYRRLRARSRSTNPAESINTRSYRRPRAQWGTTTPAGDPKLSQEAPAPRAGPALQPASHQLQIIKVNLLPHPNFTSFLLLFLLFLLIFSFTVFLKVTFYVFMFQVENNKMLSIFHFKLCS